MEKDGYEIYDLETHETKDLVDSHVNGKLTVIWRDWDKKISNPEMVYLNVIEPGEIKGPHIHKNRTSYFFCIEGSIIIIIKDKSGAYQEIEMTSENPKLVSVSNGIAAAILNPTRNRSKVLVLADVAWRPNDDEMTNVKFSDYDFKKWN